MDRNTYATYEFHSSTADANQFFVVQDDGTFLINRPVPYVAPLPDVKGCLVNVQPHTVYDVGSQQFFVDVDNSAELISVSDQFIMPDSVNGLYNNSYLLQPTPSSAVQPINVDMNVDTHQHSVCTDKETNTEDIDAETYTSEESNNFAEITLTDEQYRTLEQKGWILLEAYNKIFILNNLGLHDITANNKLIQKLKNELQNTDTGLESGYVKTEVIGSQLPYIEPETLPDQQETVEYEVDNNCEQDDEDAMESYEFVLHEKDIIETESIDEKQNKDILNMQAEIFNKSQEPETIQREKQKSSKSMKIKTKLNFTDIPDKIFLGKLVNGKRLVAKVTNRRLSPKAKPPHKPAADNQHLNVSGVVESKFVNLIQLTVRGRMRDLNTPEDVASAEDVVTQLLKVPNMNQSLLDQNLIITKTAGNKDENGVSPKIDRVKLVTGRVVLKGDVYAFEHVPDLLTSSIKNRTIFTTDDPKSKINGGGGSKQAGYITLFHIHSTEAKGSDNIVRISVTLNKRRLSLDLIHDLKRRYPSTLFACGACATTFQNEISLKEHKENQCLSADNTMDTDNKPCSILSNKKRKEFLCGLCGTTFKSMLSIQRHIKTHVGPDKNGTEKASTSGDKADSSQQSSSELYKCKMCPSTFVHQATLSKHIVAKHINVE